VTQSGTGRKLGIIGPYPPFRGGIAHFTEQLHLHLARSGAEVFGVSFSRQYPSLLFPGTSQYADSSGSAHPDVRAEPLVDSINPLSWNRVAQRLVEEGVDEVIFMYWMPFFAPAYRRIAGLLGASGIRITALVHNANPHEKQPFGTTLSRMFLSVCDRRIALSETVRRDIRSIGVESDVESLFHPIYDQFGASLDKSVARARLGLKATGPVVLFFGLVRKYKGLDILLKALDRATTQVTLLVAGEWYEGESELKQLITSLGLADRVICRNEYIPDSEVATYFSAADVLVQPYRNATQSGVVQTAYHFGKPSIVTGVGGLPEMVRHGESGLVVAPEDPEALARAIDLFYSGDTAERLSQGAVAARSAFSWEAFVSRFLTGNIDS
jgi:D-inositol-3-phosphate glycosyltransferase